MRTSVCAVTRRALPLESLTVMTSRTRAGECGRAPVRTRSPAQVRALVARFHSGTRRAVARLVASHPYVEDLLWSFPAVLHALVTANDPAKREGVLALVKAGAPLASIVRQLGIPGWMRRLPPEAFADQLPRLPDDPAFALQIANHLPKSANGAQDWLKIVAAAYRSCDAAFAIWTAREFPKLDPRWGSQGINALGLFAWYSGRRDTMAAAAIARPWHAGLGAPEAVALAVGWLHELEMQLYAPVREVRFAHANRAESVGGIAFERLMTPEQLRSEGAAMNHCLARYGSSLAKGTSIIYALSEGGRRAGTLEVRLQHPTSRPTVWCLVTAGNAEVPYNVWSAVMMWLAGWAEHEGAFVPPGDAAPPPAKLWLALWKPYWLAKGLSDKLPFRPFADPLEDHHRWLECCLKN